MTWNTFNDEELAIAVESLQQQIAGAKPKHLTRRGWDKERSQMRFQLAIYSELLDRRRGMAVMIAKLRPAHDASLPDPALGFDSSLLMGDELEMLRAASTPSRPTPYAMKAADHYLAAQVTEATELNSTRHRAHLMALLTLICNVRRAEAARG